MLSDCWQFALTDRCVCLQEEQAAKLKAENIRVALEKIKEAQVKKVSHACCCLVAASVARVHHTLFSGSSQCYSTLKALVSNSWGQHTCT